MKQWQQSHLIITATTLPVALLVCWWIYKKASSPSSKRSATPQSPVGNEDKSEDIFNVNEDEQFSAKSVLEDLCEAKVLPESALLAEMQNEKQSDNILNTSLNLTSAEDFVITNGNTSDTEKSTGDKKSTLIRGHLDGQTLKLPLMPNTKLCVSETNNGFTVPVEGNSCPTSQDADSTHDKTYSKEDISDAVNMSDKAKCDITSNAEDQSSRVNDQASEIDSSRTNGSFNHSEQHELTSSESPMSTEDQSQTTDNTLCLDDDDSSCEKDIDVNANNNNNIDPGLQQADKKKLEMAVVEKMDINGSEDSGCECCKGDQKVLCTNGCNNCESSEDTNEEITTKRKRSFQRPNVLSNLETNGVEINGNIEVFVEFPSERVGLLIGKQGRNIKQLKLDSGADVYVHEAPMREDIQVLQICGTQTEVESCVSRIKRRFNDISLNHFDGDTLAVSSPNSMSSPMNTPPPAYPVTNISQLRLPDGITVEVFVSAIANVDCVFIQQYTHPTFHALANLERAMSVCYAEPSTPDVPHPVQVGLICAVHQQGLWYRVQILRFFEETEEVTIKFMDYGGYATVPEKSLKQIRADFVTLPFQATECYIDSIAPPVDEKFCEDAVNKLQEMLQHGRFQARVTGYQADGHPRIHLFKCHRNEVILINKEMATKGLATWMEPAPFVCS